MIKDEPIIKNKFQYLIKLFITNFNVGIIRRNSRYIGQIFAFIYVSAIKDNKKIAFFQTFYWELL